MSVTQERTPAGVPVEQAICRQRLRPGSGFLSVRVTSDGPTRVLQITDSKNKKAYATLEEKDWMLINEDKRPNLITNEAAETARAPEAVPLTASSSKATAQNNDEFQLICFAKSGIGLSLVSREPPEEILYLFMANVVIDYQVYLYH